MRLRDQVLGWEEDAYKEGQFLAQVVFRGHHSVWVSVAYREMLN